MRLTVFVLASLLAFAAACSDDDEEPLVTAEPTQAGPTITPRILEQPAPAQQIDTAATRSDSGLLDVVVSDLLFQQNNIEVALGDQVTIRVTNSDLVVHNLRIAGLDGEYETEDDAVTDPNSISAGDNGELTFAPPLSGSYTFRCDFHPDTMGGVIAVVERG